MQVMMTAIAEKMQYNLLIEEFGNYINGAYDIIIVVEREK